MCVCMQKSGVNCGVFLIFETGSLISLVLAKSAQ